MRPVASPLRRYGQPKRYTTVTKWPGSSAKTCACNRTASGKAVRLWLGIFLKRYKEMRSRGQMLTAALHGNRMKLRVSEKVSAIFSASEAILMNKC